MTAELVLKTHREVFYRALLEQNWGALAHLYADEYMLVRSDGSILTKDEVLQDLKAQNLIFEMIELTDEKVRIVGSVAILTGQSESRSRHAGTVVEAWFRFVAVYAEAPDGLDLLHFQSTALAKPLTGF
jgi:ketosteroid isomerase-like protein